MGEYFVKATYRLEGDGPLVFSCFEVLTALTAAMQTACYPNLKAVAKALASGSPVIEQQLIDYGKACVKPGLDYFTSKFEHELHDTVDAFKAARLLIPSKIAEMSPGAVKVEDLKAFPFFSSPTLISNLKA